MLTEPTDNYKELCENYIIMKKKRETINKNQEEMNNKISLSLSHTYTHTQNIRNYKQGT